MCVSVLHVCMYVYHTCACGGWMKPLELLELESQMVVSYQAGAGN